MQAGLGGLNPCATLQRYKGKCGVHYCVIIQTGGLFIGGTVHLHS